MLLNDTDVRGDDEEYIYNLISLNNTPEVSDQTKSETFSTITDPKSSTLSDSVIDSHNILNFQHIVSGHTLLRLNLLQVQSFCEVFFFADDFTLDLQTVKHQNVLLKTIYNWLCQNIQPEYATSLLHGCLFLNAYYIIFSQLFIDATINLFCTKRNSFRKHTVALLLLFFNINKSLYNLNTKGFNQSTQNKS